MSTTFVAAPQAWMSSKEAAQYLRVSESWLRHDRYQGHWGLRFYRLGGRVLYRVQDLEEYLQQRALVPEKSSRPAAAQVRKGRSTKTEQFEARRQGISVAELRRRKAGGGV